MRAAAIFGLGCSPRHLKHFQFDRPIQWRIGLPPSGEVADVILVFGGDGTVHRHLNQLVSLGAPVLVVPWGSGNDFARALGLRRVQDSIAAWWRFCSGGNNVRPVDLGVVAPLNVGGAEAAQQEKPGFASRTAEGGCPHPGAVCDTVHYFASVAGVGLDAEVSRQANELPRWLRGHGGYAIALAGSLFRFAPLPMKVIARAGDGWSMRSDQPTMLAAFANTSTYGGGMKIAPHARVDDGQLDVCVIGGIDPFRLACMFPTVYFGRHLRIREVQYFQAERVRVETESPRDVYADGEFVCQTPFEVGIQRKVLPVIVGAEVDITGRSR